MSTFTRILAAMFCALIGSLSAQTSLTFNLGGPAYVESMQNSMTFANGGITATATAWSISRTAANPVFQSSEVVQWSPGIGVKNSTEVITDTPYVPYYVDNQDHYDFILFTFSKKVDLDSIMVHPSAGTFDLDVSYWTGNISSNLDLTGDTLASLTSQGFNNKINNDSVASNSPRTFNLDNPMGGVNALLVAARINGDADYDRFKISNLHVTTIPEPSSAGLMIAALAFGLSRRKR